MKDFKTWPHQSRTRFIFFPGLDGMTSTKIVIVSLLACATHLSAAEAQYSRSRELPALKMSFSDLQAILTKTFNLLSTANGQATKKEYLREELTVGAGSDELVVAGHAFPPSARVPKAIFRLSYSYSWSDAPVSSLRLDLADYTRRLTVSGSAADEVEAICASLERDISEHAAVMGGALFRNASGGCLFALLVTCFLWTGTYCIAERRWRLLGMPICSLIGLLLLVLLPFDEFLAGFAAYQGESAFLVRYGSQISFLSLVVSVATIPLAYFFPRWNDARTKRASAGRR